MAVLGLENGDSLRLWDGRALALEATAPASVIYLPRKSAFPAAGTPINQASSLAQGLVAYWPCNEQSGAIVTNNVSGKPGVLNTGASWSAGRLSLDGSTGRVNGDTGFLGRLTKFPLTMSAWFYARSSASFNFVFTLHASAGSPSCSLLFTTGNVVYYQAADGSNFAAPSLTTSNLEGRWVHLAGVSRSASRHELYVDGAFAGVSTTAITMSAVDMALLGQRWDGSAYVWPLNGLLGPCAVWNRGLTPDEIRQLAIEQYLLSRARPLMLSVPATSTTVAVPVRRRVSSPLPGTPLVRPSPLGFEPVSYLPFNEGSGAITRDVATGRSLTLYSTATWSGGDCKPTRLAIDPLFNRVKKYPFSVSLWFKPLSLATAPLFYMTGGTMTATLGLDGLGQVTSYFYNSSVGLVEDAAGGTYRANEWNHVAASFNSPSGFCKIYLNGRFVLQGNLDNWTFTSGYLGYNASTTFGGFLGQVAFFDRVLSPAQARQLYDSRHLLQQPSQATIRVPASSGRALCLRQPGDSSPERVLPNNAVAVTSTLNAGLVGWWLGLPTRTTNDRMMDLHSHRHATLIGSPIWRDGPLGFKSLLFSNDTQAASAGTSSDFSAAVGVPMSFVAVIQPTTTSPTQYGPIATRMDVSLEWGFYLTSSNQLHLWWKNSGGGDAVVMTYSAGLVANTTAVVGFTMDPAGSAALYVNGVSIGSTTFSSFTPRVNASEALQLGGEPFTARSFRGLLGDCRLWRGHALSDAEHLRVYQETLARHPDTLRRLVRSLFIPYVGTNYEVFAAGGLSLSGECYPDWSLTTTGGVVLQAVATPELSLSSEGGGVLAGETLASLSLEAQGGVLLAGETSLTLALECSGGLVLAGDGILAADQVLLADGGLVLAESLEALADYTQSASGSLLLAGEAELAATFQVDTVGGVDLDGEGALILAAALESLGGVQCSGTGGDLIDYASDTTGAWILAGQAADVQDGVLTATGGALLDGDAAGLADYVLDADGSTSGSGSAPLTLEPGVSGGLVTDGSVPPGLEPGVSGGTILGGLLPPSLLLSPTGGVTLDGDGSLAQDATQDATGGMVAAGSGADLADYAQLSTGGAVLSDAGVVQLDYATDGTAGVVLAGAGAVTLALSAADGVVISGTFAALADLTADAAGGVILAGTSVLSTDWAPASQGGLLVSAAGEDVASYVPAPEGGVLLSGEATAVANTLDETMAGGLILAGSASSVGDYADASAGGLALAAVASQVQALPVAATGSLLLAGSSTITGVFTTASSGGPATGGPATDVWEVVSLATGGLSLAGAGAGSLAADLAASGGISAPGSAVLVLAYAVALTGGAVIAGDQTAASLDLSATGGATLSAAATAESELVALAAAGVSLAGSADASGGQEAIASGGLALAGSSSYQLAYAPSAAAGASLLGDSSLSLSLAASGYVVLGGAADAYANRLAEVMSGGLSAGGSAVLALGSVDTSAGGVALAGQGAAAMDAHWSAAGGLLPGGEVGAVLDYVQSAAGGLLSGGQSPADQAVDTTGSLSLSDTIAPTVSLSATGGGILSGLASVQFDHGWVSTGGALVGGVSLQGSVYLLESSALLAVGGVCVIDNVSRIRPSGSLRGSSSGQGGSLRGSSQAAGALRGVVAAAARLEGRPVVSAALRGFVVAPGDLRGSSVAPGALRGSAAVPTGLEARPGSPGALRGTSTGTAGAGDGVLRGEDATPEPLRGRTDPVGENPPLRGEYD